MGHSELTPLTPQKLSQARPVSSAGPRCDTGIAAPASSAGTALSPCSYTGAERLALGQGEGSRDWEPLQGGWQGPGREGRTWRLLCRGRATCRKRADKAGCCSRRVMELRLPSEQSTADTAQCSQVELHLPPLLPVPLDDSHGCRQARHSQPGHWGCPGQGQCHHQILPATAPGPWRPPRQQSWWPRKDFQEAKLV